MRALAFAEPPLLDCRISSAVVWSTFFAIQSRMPLSARDWGGGGTPSTRKVITRMPAYPCACSGVAATPVPMAQTGS